MEALEITRPICSLRHRFPNPNPNPRPLPKSPLLRLYSSWTVTTTFNPLTGGFATKRIPFPPNLPLAADSTTSSLPADEIGRRRYGDVMGTTSPTPNPVPDDEIGTRRYGDVMETTSYTPPTPGTGISSSSNSKPHTDVADQSSATGSNSTENRSFIAVQNAGSSRTYIDANETTSSSSNSNHYTDAIGKLEKRSTIDDQSSGRRMHDYVTGISSSSSSSSSSKPHTDAADKLEKTSMVSDQSRGDSRMYGDGIGTSSSNSRPYTDASDKLEKMCTVDQSSGISIIMYKDVIGTSSSNLNPYPDVADTPEKTSVVTDKTSCSDVSSGVYGDMMGTSSSNSKPDPIDTDKPEKRSVVADQSSASSRIYNDVIGTSSSSSRKSKPDPIAVDKPYKPLKAINTTVVDESSDNSWEDRDVIRRYNNNNNNNNNNNVFIKKGKSKPVHVCDNCGHTEGQWWGTCRECKMSATFSKYAAEGSDMSQAKVSDKRSWFAKNAAAATPIKLSEVRSQISHIDWRIPLTGPFGTEVARVLGGGLVPGSLVLVGGDPGVGKSTMLLQIAAVIAQANDVNGQARVMYVSGEESVEQIGNRADRLNIQTDELYLHSSTDVEEILEQAQHLSPKALVIDSIQTVYLSGVTGSAGGVSQLKECTSALLRFAKKTNIAVFLIGHVTKSGEIAGPRVFEHIVDVVLYMEGEKLSSHRLLRSVKNRFGSTDELGVFEMSNSGLQAVSNPIGMFLGEQFSKSDYLAGLAVAVILDGSRAFLIEVQALCVVGSSSLRHVNGVQNSRADMIISVLTKQAAVKLQENGIFINVISGTNLTERAGDLAIAAAICSSYMERPVPNGTTFIAEIGLGGELRMVPQLEKRIKALAKLGFRRCIVPKSAEKSFAEMYESQENLEIVGCLDLKEMIEIVF